MLPADEKKLFAEDPEGARETVLLHSVAEGVYYARRCCRQSFTDAELVSLVYSALARAIKNFDPVKFPKGRFFSYGKIYIRGELKREWARRDVVRNSSSHETMIELDCGDDSDSDDSTVKMRQEPGLHPSAVVTEEMNFRAMEIKELMTKLRPVMASVLTEKEQKVMQRYYENGETFESIAKSWRGTRQAVQCAHRIALGKIRKHLEVYPLV